MTGVHVSTHAGSDPDGLEFGGTLAQSTFLEVGQAADDLQQLFSAAPQPVAATFTVWALQQASRCGRLLADHALAPHALPSGVVATSQVVALAAVFCASLEASHRLSLSSAFMAELRPSLEGTGEEGVRLQAYLRCRLLQDRVFVGFRRFSCRCC